MHQLIHDENELKKIKPHKIVAKIKKVPKILIEVKVKEERSINWSNRDIIKFFVLYFMTIFAIILLLLAGNNWLTYIFDYFFLQDKKDDEKLKDTDDTKDIGDLEFLL